MMMTIRLGLLALVMSCTAFAASESDQATYLQRFETYRQWHEALPTKPDEAFNAFITENKPLSNKLREQWLYQLAKKNDWATYLHYYQQSNDTNLACYQLTAKYKLGQEEGLIEALKPLWLVGHAQPKACDVLFAELLKKHQISDALITKRVQLALDARNLSLARYLLKQLSVPDLDDANHLNDIYRNPSHITQLSPSPLHSAFYLYGLKRMVAANMDQAVTFWRHVKTANTLNEAQQQAFLIHLVLYKAMRNQTDTPYWFNKIKPAYYTPILLDWRIRYALRQARWKKVAALITHSSDAKEPIWQYWLARAYEAQGKKELATPIYETLAQTRNYYGFLASMRLKKPMHFENEHPIADNQILKGYQPLLADIKSLYQNKQVLQASRLLNDFMLELSTEEKSALAFWLAQELQWYGKAIYFGNSKELSNQLVLRFPLAHFDTITQHAGQYGISPQLVYAIIRQESMFRDDAVSSAGAYGLMQVLPTTAKKVTKQERIAFSEPKELFHAPKNIHIGIAYLRQLAAHYQHNPLLMAAAYNAGPKQVNLWLKKQPRVDVDIWIETLPWHETRNYLKNIIAFYAVYEYRMHKKPDLRRFLKPFHLEKK